MKHIAITLIRLPIAILATIVCFVFGYLVWVFCLLMGPILLIKDLTYNPLVYFGVLPGCKNDLEWDWEFHLIGVRFAIIGFSSIMS